MSHLDEGTLHAMLDGELEPNDVAEIQAHLASCSSCGLRLREVREFLDEADRLIASVEMDGATAAPMRRVAPIEATPEMARSEPVHEPVRAEPTRPEPIHAEPVHAEPVHAEPVHADPPRAEAARVEPPARPERPVRHDPPVRPEPPVRAEVPAAAAPRRPVPPTRPEPRPVPDRPVGQETWNAPPPPLLMPDNESAGDRRMRRVRKYGWAAMIAVFVGAGFVGTRLREPAQAAFDASISHKAADAIVSPEETARPAAPTSDGTPTALATRPPLPKAGTAPNSPARADAPKDALKGATTDAGKVRGKTAEAGRVAEKDAREATEPKAEAPPPDTAAPADEANQDSSGTEDLTTVRARAADALADLDRERRRNEAAAATAALDAQRRRRNAAQPAGAAAPTVARAAQAAAPPPNPPTLEQRAQVYLRIGLDEASRQLGGPVHVIEGMSAMFMGLAQGVVVPGADATRPVVRVVYQDSQGRLILLDQQRLRPGQPAPQGSPLGWVLGETAIWLHGEVAPDALRTYQPRVR
jgi:Putative zinc-finger